MCKDIKLCILLALLFGSVLSEDLLVCNVKLKDVIQIMLIANMLLIITLNNRSIHVILIIGWTVLLSCIMTLERKGIEGSCVTFRIDHSNMIVRLFIISFASAIFNICCYLYA